jgi:hypothetical protein
MGVGIVDMGVSGGGGRVDLAVSGDVLDPVAGAARGLYDDLDVHGCAAEGDVLGAAGEFRQAGMASGQTLGTLAEWWRRQCDDLLGDCARVSGHLDRTVREHEGLEDELRASFGRIEAGAWGGAGPAVVGPDRALLRDFGIEVDDEPGAG